MRWPPNKAWTSTSIRKGFRHFVAINYGGKGATRWVALVSVLDGKARFRVAWDEMKDPSQWVSGWKSICFDKEGAAIPELKETAEDIEVCLHPSADSGLRLPIDTNPLRPWFEPQN